MNMTHLTLLIPERAGYRIGGATAMTRLRRQGKTVKDRFLIGSRGLRNLQAVLVVAVLCQCAPDGAPREDTVPSGSSSSQTVAFIDVAQTAGVTFRHVNGASPEKYFPETAGGGGMLWDYDGDGRLDIYLVNGGWLGVPERVGQAVNALYRNEGEGLFAQVAERAGVDHPGYGMGCAAADYDNDGDRDLFVTNYGPNVLFRNEGDGSFSDQTNWAGVGDARWGTGAAFGDFDLDGDLDLYSANYVEYDLERDSGVSVPYLPAADLDNYDGTVKAYPHPGAFDSTVDILYRNDGEDGFTDITAPAGIHQAGPGKGLGVVFSDLDRDGWPDIYVANDLVRNFLFFNNGDGTFQEAAVVSGTAYGQDGSVEAGMGVDVADYDNDGLPDLTVTNFQKEPNTLYRNEGNRYFHNETFSSGTGLVSLPPLGFGTNFLDYDNDGDQDLFVANGHVLDNVLLFDASTTYAQANLLFRNDGRNRYGKFAFTDVSLQAGAGMELVQVSRGSATGDYDEDGDLDILVINLNEPVALLRNDGGNNGNWLVIGVSGTHSNRDGIGTRIRIEAGGLRQVGEVRGSGSYLTQRDLRVHFGLGDHARVDSLEVLWPGGETERLGAVEANQFIEIRQGAGIVDAFGGG